MRDRSGVIHALNASYIINGQRPPLIADVTFNDQPFGGKIIPVEPLLNGVNATSMIKSRRRSDEPQGTAVINIDAETTAVASQRYHRHFNQHQHHHRHHNQTRKKKTSHRRRYDVTEGNSTTFLDESFVSHAPGTNRK